MRDIKLEETIYPKFTTRAFATGIPATLGGTPVLSVYEENNATQITSGVSVSADYDSVTGLNQATVAATAANGYEAGKSYDIVITTGTVSSVSVVGEVVDSFTIEASAAYDAASSIGTGSSGAVNVKATEDNSSGAIIDGISKVGTITGDFNNVHADTGGTTIVSIAAVGNDIDFVLGYDVGGSNQGSSVSIVANVNGNADSMTVEAYDHIGAGWDVIGIINGSGGSSYVTKELPLYAEHTGTGGELGKVYIRWDNNATTPSLLEIDRCSVSSVSTSTSVGYAMGAYWIDSAGTSGTEIGTNGTADNPCPWANAITMNGTQALNRFAIANGNTVNLSANSDAYTLFGENWSLALGNQSIEGTSVSGALVTGTGTATVTRPTFKDCSFGTCTMPPCCTDRCSFGVGDGLFTAGSAGDYDHNQGRSAVAGSGSPDQDYTIGSGTTTVQNRGWFGGIVYTLDATTTLSHEVVGGGGTTINSNGGDAEIRGTCRSLTLVMTDSETIQFVGITGPIAISGTTLGTVNLHGVSTSLSDTTTAATVTDNTVRKTELTTIDTVVDGIQTDLDNGTDGLGALLAAINAGGSSPQLLQTTTIATLASQVNFTLTAGSADDDAYNNQMVVVTDSATSTQKAIGLVSDYTGSTKTITLDVDPGVFTMATGDTIDIIAISGSSIGLSVDASGNVTLKSGTHTGAIVPTVSTVTDLNLGIIYGAAATGTLSTTQATTDLTGYADDQLIDAVIIATSGAAEGERSDITDYASASGLITFTAMTTAMSNGDTFKIV